MLGSNFEMKLILMFYHYKTIARRFTVVLVVITAGLLGSAINAFSQSSFSDADSLAYLTPTEYAMMLDRNDQFIYRLDLLAGGMEWAFADKFSLLGEIGVEQFPFGRVELRRYFETKNIEHASLNGLYISLGAEAFNNNGWWRAPYSQFYFARLGLQRRFLGKGLADLGIRAGYVNENLAEYQFIGNDFDFETINSRYFLMEAHTSIGLAFTPKRSVKLDYEKLCPVIKCYDTERFLIKVNVANSFQLAAGQSFDVYLQPSVAVEQKIRESPFSVQAKLKLRQAFSATNQSELYSWSYRNGFTADFEGRYYYNLKRRIAKGKTGNSLSANYVSLVYSRRDQWTYNDGNGNPGSYHENGIFVQTGIQRTFGERLYIDVYIGFGITEWTENLRSFEVPGAVECGWRF